MVPEMLIHIVVVLQKVLEKGIEANFNAENHIFKTSVIN